MTDYQAARAEVERLLSWPGADEEPDDNIRIVRVGHLRTLLAGPPEPSVEEVARVLDPWMFEDDARLAAQAVQALYRSKAND